MDGYPGGPGGPKPLAGHLLFHTGDLDEAREQVARVFCPHRLELVGRGRMQACHHHVRGERMSLNFIAYGAKTLISPGELGSFYLLQIPLTGAAAIRNGPCQYGSTPLAAAVLNPHHETTMIWEEGTEQILVQIDRDSLQTHLSGLLGVRADKPLTFMGPLDLKQGGGRALACLILHLVNGIDAGHGAFGGGGLMSRQIESTILTGLIEALPNNYSHLLGLGGGAARPRHLRRAEEFIEAHLDQPITLDDIAAAACTTPRSLQNAFRKFRDTTPLRYLRDARLARAHQDLLTAGPGSTVTDIALRWGFTHLGRFSQAYRARFGETPQATLRAARTPVWSG